MALKDKLLEEFRHDYKNGLYHLFSCKLAYHSNKIEGSRLSEDQTAFLFETNEVCQGDNTYVPKDVEEARGHFLMFNHMLKTMDEPLTEDLIKKFHYYLKFGVFDDIINGRPIGDYKITQNYVGTLKTATPAEVSLLMSELLLWYNSLGEPNLKDLAEFHVRYEEIHPFADGNGRTGRIILFRESLLHTDYPIIIDSATDTKYKSILARVQKNRDFKELADFFKIQQSYYEDIVNDYTEEKAVLTEFKDIETDEFMVINEIRTLNFPAPGQEKISEVLRYIQEHYDLTRKPIELNLTQISRDTAYSIDFIRNVIDEFSI